VDEGLCVGLAEALGPVIGGVIIHKRRMSRRHQLKLVIAVLAVSTLLLLLIVAADCPDAGFVWQNTTFTYGSFTVCYLLNRWLGSRVVSVLDSGAEGSGFKSQSRRCRVTVLGKLFTPIVPLFTKQQNW